jgi:two-component system sensor histidine kinase NreB
MFPSLHVKSRNSACEQKAGAPASEQSRHLLRAQEAERKRISRELHDGTGQSLMVLRLYLAMLANDEQSPESQAKIQEALQLLDHTVEDLRRIISRLSPRMLEELGLLAAIRKEARELSKNAGMKAHLDLPEDLGQLDCEFEVAIYRSLQEALHNVAKHSQAQNFSVRLERSGNSICLFVEDDGVGVSTGRVSTGHAFGLFGMKQRIAALGGKVQIRSHRDKGTLLKVMLPVPAQRLAPVVSSAVRPKRDSPADKSPLVMAAKSS